MGWPRKDSPELSFNNIYSTKEDINETYHVSVNTTVEKDSIITDEVDGESKWIVSFDFDTPMETHKKMLLQDLLPKKNQVKNCMCRNKCLHAWRVLLVYTLYDINGNTEETTNNLPIEFNFLLFSRCFAPFFKFNATYVCSFVNIKSRFEFIN